MQIFLHAIRINWIIFLLWLLLTYVWQANLLWYWFLCYYHCSGHFFRPLYWKNSQNFLFLCHGRSESEGLLNFESLKLVVSRNREGNHHLSLLVFKNSFLEELFKKRRKFKIWKRWNKATWRVEIWGTVSWVWLWGILNLSVEGVKESTWL